MFEALTFDREQVVERWIEWLRHGPFQQIDGSLGYDIPDEPQKRCCLGVVCDVVRSFNPEFYMSVDVDNNYEVEFGEEKESTLLPEEVSALLQFDQQSGEVYVPGYGNIWYTFDLASLNDDGLSFDQIADLIEAGYVGMNAEAMAHADGQEVSEFRWNVEQDPTWRPSE